MADLTGVSDTLPVRLGGVSLSSGLPDNYADVNANAQLLVFDAADGPVTPGTVAGNSALIGGQYNSALPTLTTGQQSAIQVDSSGRLIISPLGNNKDNSGTGTITALNEAVVAITNGCGSVAFNVLGTWIATLTVEATVDGTNWETVNGNIVALDDTVQFFASNAFLVVPCGGFSQVRLAATAFTSGTIAIAWNAGAGTNVTPVFNNVAAAFNAQVVGNVASGSADSGNGVKMSGVFNTTVPAITNGQRSDIQTDSRGAIQITTLDGSRATYSATSAIGFASAVTATDIFTITGSATKTIRVLRVAFSAQETTAGVANVLLIKRSAANTGGTSAAATVVPHDSANAAGTATVLNYTANPSALGAAVGTVRAARLFIPTTGTDTADFANEWDFGMGPEQAVVLRGITQVLAINLNSTTVIGGTWTCYIEWTEE
jgi:hypothetical protein